MITAIILFAGATVFFLGFVLGYNFPLTVKREYCRHPDRMTGETLCEEYKNFLNYDGTVN